jgi:hypothetical protein
MQARDFFDEPQAAPGEHRREAAPEPVRRQAAESRGETPVPRPAPAPAAQAAAPVVFHAVSEHDAAVEEAHRPVRRRKQTQAEADAAQAALQLVETQVEVPLPVAVDDEPPRRTRPRKRRGGPVANEPLMLVETQPGAEATRADNQP